MVGHPYRLVAVSALIVGATVLIISAALVVTRGMGGDEPALAGTQLDGRQAPDFTLTDHRGQTVSLSDFRGKAMALTFIYTHCPDICPLVAENLRIAFELLPADVRDDVALLAVTVHPGRDTQQALQAFTTRHRLADNPHWFALRGDPSVLGQVWRNFGIYPGMTMETPVGLGSPAASGGEGHTDGIYFIDPEGRARVFLRSRVTPQEIAANLTALLGGGTA